MHQRGGSHSFLSHISPCLSFLGCRSSLSVRMSQAHPPIGDSFRTANEILSQEAPSSSSSSSSCAPPSSSSLKNALADPHPYRAKLWEAICTIDNKSSYCASANISDPVSEEKTICYGNLPPGIEVDNVGRLAFPLCLEQSRILLENADHARFRSYGSTGELEFNTSKAYMISGKKVKLHSRWRENFLPDIIKSVCKRLGLDDQKIGISASLYRLLYFSEGGFLRDPQDRDSKEMNELPVSRRPFATILLQLPSEHNGGGVTINHNSMATTFCYDGANSADTVSYTVFYQNCDVIINPLDSGRSIYLAFHLYRTIDSQIPLNPPLTSDEVSRIVYSSHDQWVDSTNDSSPEKLLFALKNTYSYENLSFSKLTPEDQRIIHFLNSFSLSGRPLFHVFLVNVKVVISQQSSQSSYTSPGFSFFIEKFVSADAGVLSIQIGIDAANETMTNQLPKYPHEHKSMICLWPTARIVDFILQKKGNLDEALWYIQQKKAQNCSNLVNIQGNLIDKGITNDTNALFSYLRKQHVFLPIQVVNLLKIYEDSLIYTKEILQLVRRAGGMNCELLIDSYFKAVEKHGWSALKGDILDGVEALRSSTELTLDVLAQVQVCLKFADVLLDNSKRIPQTQKGADLESAAKTIGASVIGALFSLTGVVGDSIQSGMESVCEFNGYVKICGACVERLKKDYNHTDSTLARTITLCVSMIKEYASRKVDYVEILLFILSHVMASDISTLRPEHFIVVLYTEHEALKKLNGDLTQKLTSKSNEYKRIVEKMNELPIAVVCVVVSTIIANEKGSPLNSDEEALGNIMQAGLKNILRYLNINDNEDLIKNFTRELKLLRTLFQQLSLDQSLMKAAERSNRIGTGIAFALNVRMIFKSNMVVSQLILSLTKTWIPAYFVEALQETFSDAQSIFSIMLQYPSSLIDQLREFADLAGRLPLPILINCVNSIQTSMARGSLKEVAENLHNHILNKSDFTKAKNYRNENTSAHELLSIVMPIIHIQSDAVMNKFVDKILVANNVSVNCMSLTTIKNFLKFSDIHTEIKNNSSSPLKRLCQYVIDSYNTEMPPADLRWPEIAAYLPPGGYWEGIKKFIAGPEQTYRISNFKNITAARKFQNSILNLARAKSIDVSAEAAGVGKNAYCDIWKGTAAKMRQEQDFRESLAERERFIDYLRNDATFSSQEGNIDCPNTGKRQSNGNVGLPAKKIKSNKGDEDDDEIEVLEQELTENDFKCPYTGSKFVIAMSNTNCKHHLDDKAIVDMCKGGRTWFNCPVAACSEQWTVNPRSFKRDFDFEMKMRDFFNARNQRRWLGIDDVCDSSNSNAEFDCSTNADMETTNQTDETAATSSSRKNNVPVVDLSLDDSEEEANEFNEEDDVAREVREMFGSPNLPPPDV